MDECCAYGHLRRASYYVCQIRIIFLKHAMELRPNQLITLLHLLF
jgi:hypothetical protein